MLGHYLAVETAQFEIRYVAGESQFATETLRVLEDAFGHIAHYFQLTDAFPQVRVVLVIERDEFDRLVRDLLRIEIEVPSHPARIAQPQRTDMVVVSPSAYGSATIFQYHPDEFGRLLVHELVHMVEEYLSPNIEASPRWWGEGLAVYFSEQWLYDDEFRKPVMDGIAQKVIPTLPQIEAEVKLAYEWGWTVVWFLEKKFGQGMILKIIRECIDGDIFSMIGEDVGQLENQWRYWLLTEAQNAHPQALGSFPLSSNNQSGSSSKLNQSNRIHPLA